MPRRKGEIPICILVNEGSIINTLFFFIIGAYFLGMLFIGCTASRLIHTMEDYLVAGRRLPFYLAVPTIVATWFGAGACMGVSGTVYSQGFYGVIADPFGCALALIIAGLFFAVPFRRLRLITISDLLGQHFGPGFEKIATLLTVPFYIGTLASNILAMGYLFQIVSEGNLVWGILLGSCIVMFYTVKGGMWAVTITDFVQLGILILGLCLLLPICMNHAPNLKSTTQTFLQEFGKLIPNDAVTHNTMWMGYLGRIFMTGLGAIMGQDMIQRFLASRNEKIARSSGITAGFLYLALGLIPLFVGIAGQDILPNLEKPEQLIPLLAQQYLSPIGFTVFTCGLLAAIMSTADSYLLAGTSLLVNNVFLKIYPIKTEQNKIRLLRGTNVVFCLLAVGLALSGPSIFDLMVHSGATLFVSILVPACAALFWGSRNRAAAWGSLWGGLVAWLLFITFHYFNFNFLGSENFTDTFKDTFTQNYDDILFSAAFFGAVVSLAVYICVCWFLHPFYNFLQYRKLRI